MTETDTPHFEHLLEAVKSANQLRVRELLQAGADVNLQNNDGWTALMMACRYCNGDSSMECVRELLQAGADVNLQNNDGWTALMMACRFCNSDSSMECVRELLRSGADVNLQNNDGWTVKKIIFELNNFELHEIYRQVELENMKKEILQDLQEQLWSYGGVGYELLQLKNGLLGMKN